MLVHAPARCWPQANPDRLGRRRSLLGPAVPGLAAASIRDSSVAKGTCPNRPRFLAACQGPRGLSVCGLNPIMIANAGAGHCDVPGSIRNRPCTGLWRNGPSAGCNRGRQMQCCAAACGVAGTAAGWDGGRPAGSGPYRPDHGCAGLATAPRGHILVLSKRDGWSHDHPVYRSHAW